MSDTNNNLRVTVRLTEQIDAALSQEIVLTQEAYPAVPADKLKSKLIRQLLIEAIRGRRASRKTSKS